MSKLIFFGHDARDAAVRRRIKAFQDAGADVTGFTMRRGDNAEQPWTNVDLGRTQDAAFAQRIMAMAAALPILSAHHGVLKNADVFYARNLDMGFISMAAKAISGSKARIVYECLDVHRLMTRENIVGKIMRGAERALLKQSSLLVVSSPAFLSEYFEKRHPGAFRALMVENRLPAGTDYGPRPAQARGDGPITIGWFGNLRCKRSLALLLALADKFPERVRITMRGYPALTEIPDFEKQVSGRANVSYGGRYAWPDDLAAIYRDCDLVWAGDFHDPGANSQWLLPNRVYEGGYFAAVPVAPEASETGRWVAKHGFGFTLPEKLEETLPALVAQLDRATISAKRAQLLATNTDVFVQPDTEMKALLDAASA